MFFLLFLSVSRSQPGAGEDHPTDLLLVVGGGNVQRRGAYAVPAAKPDATTRASCSPRRAAFFGTPRLQNLQNKESHEKNLHHAELDFPPKEMLVVS